GTAVRSPTWRSTATASSASSSTSRSARTSRRTSASSSSSSCTRSSPARPAAAPDGVRRPPLRSLRTDQSPNPMPTTQLQMPEGVQVEEMNDTYGRFVVQPLERGFGVTIGNAFRRVLLSSLGGTAITAIKIDGVQHEFSTIPGVTEDVTDIILNLKGVRFKAGEEDEGMISLHLEGPGTWTAKDLADATSDFEILNPDHHIATLAEDAELRV